MPAKASEYFTKFSKLVRLILQNSKSSLIPLESELESLALYLDLEGLRFDHHFSYHITIPPGMEIALMKVPPLIIQPYVENAIWHGLMHLPDRQAGIVAEIKRLKEMDGPDLWVHGSGNLIQTLLKNELVDGPALRLGSYIKDSDRRGREIRMPIAVMDGRPLSKTVGAEIGRAHV